MPSGMTSVILGSASFTAAETSSGLAVDCLTTPSATAGLPMNRVIVRSSRAPIMASPTSRSRTR